MKLAALFPLLAATAFAQLPADQITVPPGFKVELLHAASEREGSWISLAIDDKGRLYISPQGAIPESGFDADKKWGGLWRVTLGEGGAGNSFDKVPLPIGNAMGLLWAFDRLYVSGSGPEGRAIYTLDDSERAGTLDRWMLFKKIPGGDGEHGAHALVLGPDKKIYIAHGNSTPLLDGIAPDSPYKNYAEDTLLPRIMDPVATFFDKLKAPYGHILRTDADGQKWELFAGGLRNAYDLDFNADGELFTFDSDMEWDVGLPWYRPTRILHLVPGGEYGFREGNSKWPAWREDLLPPVCEVGLGCPTGVKFGTHAAFPEKYRRAFFAMDWTFGRILAVHMKPSGATYEAKSAVAARPDTAASSEDVEEFVKGKGLPVTDLEFGKDGAMYFITGGRGTRSALYRVSWVGKVEPDKTKPNNIESMERAWTERAQRVRRATAEAARKPAEFSISGEEPDGSRKTLHRIDAALTWLELSPPDGRFGIFAARSLVEAFPPAEIEAATLSEASPRAALTALLALARVGGKESVPARMKLMAKFPFESLDDDLKLLKLRVIALALARDGWPGEEVARLATGKLLQHYPAKGDQAWPLNHETSEILVWLTNPPAAARSAQSRPPSFPHPAGWIGPRLGWKSDRGGWHLDPAGRGIHPTGWDADRAGWPSDPAGWGIHPAGRLADPAGWMAHPVGWTAHPAGWTGHPIRQLRQIDAKAKDLASFDHLAAPKAAAAGKKPQPAGSLLVAAGNTPIPVAVAVDFAAFLATAKAEVIEKTLALLDKAPRQEEAIHFATMLAHARGPWPAGQRERYWKWWAETVPGFKGGNSFPKFMAAIRERALSNATAEERAAAGPILATPPKPRYIPPARPFVQAWTLKDLEPALPAVGAARDLARGKRLYAEAQCAACHKFKGEGGDTGPDLTAAAARYPRRDLLEAILDPGKGISEQYAVFAVKQFDGAKEVTGMIVGDNQTEMQVMTDALQGTIERINKYQEPTKTLLPVSFMPPGLLATLSKEEVLDLLAYLESGVK